MEIKPKLTMETIKTMLKNEGWYFSPWHIDDVMSREEHYPEIDFTEEFCHEVLEACINNHDAELGINWNTIDFWIENIAGEE